MSWSQARQTAVLLGRMGMVVWGSPGSHWEIFGEMYPSKSTFGRGYIYFLSKDKRPIGRY